MFVGSVSAAGTRWGFRSTGPAVGRQVYAGGVVGDVVGLADGVMRVTVPMDFSNTVQLFTAPTVPFLVATGSGAGSYAVYRVTRVCPVPVPPTENRNKLDFHVETTTYGTGGGAGGKWKVCGVAENLFGPAKTSFWTDQAAFAYGGAAGQAGSVTIPGLRSDLDFTLTFAGGIQTAVSAGAGMTPYGSNFGVTYGGLFDGGGSGPPDYHGATAIAINDLGLVYSIVTIP